MKKGLPRSHAPRVLERRREALFVAQGERGSNAWQVHRSGWTAKRLRELGYTVTGVHGLRFLRGGRPISGGNPSGCGISCLT